MKGLNHASSRKSSIHLSKNPLNDPSTIYLSYRGVRYILETSSNASSNASSNDLSNSSSTLHLSYRGVRYILETLYLMTPLQLTDIHSSDVQIPSSFQPLLYRGQPYLRPRY